MSEGIKKFVELMKTDEEFQAKLKAALEKYDGERTEEAIFQKVLAPLAGEYGISATFEEYKGFIQKQELSEEELAQISGGTYKPSTNLCLSKGIPVPGTPCAPCGSPIDCGMNGMA